MLVATKGVPAMKTRALGAITALGGMILLGGLSACGTADAATWHGKDGAVPTTSASPVASITTPANGATNVSTAVELALGGTDPKTARYLARKGFSEDAIETACADPVADPDTPVVR